MFINLTVRYNYKMLSQHILEKSQVFLKKYKKVIAVSIDVVKITVYCSICFKLIYFLNSNNDYD